MTQTSKRKFKNHPADNSDADFATVFVFRLSTFFRHSQFKRLHFLLLVLYSDSTDDQKKVLLNAPLRLDCRQA